MLDQAVLARLHLEAVLSNLEIMATDDEQSRPIAGGWNGSILFKAGLSGPSSTLAFSNSRISLTPGKQGKPDVVLFFPTEKLMNNMFTGSGVGFPLVLKGFTKLKGLLVFIKLAKRMEEVLKGVNPPIPLKAKLTVNTLPKGIAILVNHDKGMNEQKSHLPDGIAEFRIKDGFAAHVVYKNGYAHAEVGRAKKPDFIMEFSSDKTTVDVADDKVDIMASICLGDISMKGNLHMGDVLNGYLDRLSLYLQ